MLDDPAKRIEQWTSIPNAALDDEPGWIEGTVAMVFQPKTKADCVIQNQFCLQKLTVSVTCRDWSLFKFTIGQSIRLSLRGARISMKPPSSAPGAIGFSLTFSEGAAVKFVVGKGVVPDGEVFDTWNEPKKEDADWFSTPAQLQIPESVDGPNPSNRHKEDKRPTQNMQADAIDSREPSPSLAASASSPSISSPATPGPEEYVHREASVNLKTDDYSRRLKRRKEIDDHHRTERQPQKSKRQKKRDTRHENRDAKATGRSSASVTSNTVQESKRRSSSYIEESQRGPEQAAVSRTPLPSPSPPRNPALDFEAGFTAEGGAYPALDALTANMTTNVIGVVVGNEEPQVCKNGDYKISITLADPSKYMNGRGLKVTCFMRPEQRGLLPSAALGDVLLLRNVRTAAWLGNINGSIYPDKLKWIAYSPSTGKTYFPEESALHPGFDTFYQARMQELQYFVKLGEWWRAVKEEEERGAIKIETFERNKREHRLIGDCSCGEFFNATIEIVKRYEDYEQTVFLFSDYTPHVLRSTTGAYGQWAVSANTSMIPEERLNIMTVGTFQYLKNVRLKMNKVNDLEMDLYAAECTELDPTEDANDLHLQALLKRKEKYLADHPQSEEKFHANGHEVTTISEISEPGSYNIIAELIFRYSGRENSNDLFVTDYTENVLLSDFKPPSLKRIIEDKPDIPLIQIAAWDGLEFLRQQKAGSIFIFQDVRINADHSGGYRGNLKLAEQRITKINIKGNKDSRVIELLKRKDEFEKRHLKAEASEEKALINPTLARGPDDDSRLCLAIDSQHLNQRASTIEDIKKNVNCPNKFRLRARIVDFYPLDISDFCARRCRNCKQSIPDNRNACTRCEDVMAEYVEHVFRFFFVLEDESKDKLMVDCCSEGAPFLSGLEPCDLREDRDRLMAVKRRFRTLLGNLVEVHEGIKRQENVKADYGPYLDIAIKSWEVGDDDGKILVYSLTGCKAPELR